MASALSVARYLIHLAATGDEPDYLSPLRLQKLLYYVQGWSLAERNKPMFSEKLRAWVHGPVVKEVYDAFKGKSSNAIPSEEGSREGLEVEECEFIEKVWVMYKPYSAFALTDMTHEEAPWIEARAGLAPHSNCENALNLETMRAYFISLKG